MAAIGSGEHGGYSYLSSYDYSYRGDAYNYVFFNTVDSSINMLLPNNDYLIVQAISYPEKNDNGKATDPTKWFLYRLIKRDSNQDGNLSYNDLETLAISDAGGKNYSEVISDVSLIFGRALRDENTLTVIYLKNSRKFYSIIDLINKEVSLTNELPSIGTDVQ